MTETKLTKAIVKATDSEAEGERAAAVMEKAVESDPVLQNALGQEPLIQSGVVIGGSGGILWSVAVLVLQVTENGTDLKGYDQETMALALGALGNFAFILYRRLMPGLKPLFYGWFK